MMNMREITMMYNVYEGDNCDDIFGASSVSSQSMPICGCAGLYGVGLVCVLLVKGRLKRLMVDSKSEQR